MTRSITTLLLLAGSGAALAQSSPEEFRLDAYAFLNATVGKSSANEANHARHAHDPNDTFTLQGLELTLKPQFGEFFSGSFTYNTFLDNDDKIEGEWEDAYLHFKGIPGAGELRAGRLLTNVTAQNNSHLHNWNFVDANLILTRFLGDEGLITNGVEFAFSLPTEQKNKFLIGFGDPVPHEEHGHGHGEEDDDDDDEHHDEIEGEGSLFTDNVFSIRYEGEFFTNDFNQFRYGATFITGDTEYGTTSHVYGLDFQYLWRENGIEEGGKFLRLDVETIYRSFDYRSEDGDESGSASEWGFLTAVGYGFSENWEIGARYGYTEGIDALGETPEQHRYSLALTRRYTVNEHVKGLVRLQYNYDKRSDMADDENSIWLQFGFEFGN